MMRRIRAIIDNTYTVTLSPDETKLYYVVSVTNQSETTPVNQEHDGSERLFILHAPPQDYN